MTRNNKGRSLPYRHEARSTASSPAEAGPTAGPIQAYAPTAKEKAVLEAHLARRQRTRPLPRQIVEAKDGTHHLSDDHPDPPTGASLTMEALGLSRVAELTGLLQHVVDLTQKDRKPDQYAINHLLALIASVEPQDGIEAMLATQMGAVHQAALRAARQLRASETIPQQDSNSNSFAKLARTFAMQVEALKRYRSGGEQRVTVKHVTVNEGGQAIVGNVDRSRGRGADEN
jgi:hypothetical protein